MVLSPTPTSDEDVAAAVREADELREEAKRAAEKAASAFRETQEQLEAERERLAALVAEGSGSTGDSESGDKPLESRAASPMLEPNVEQVHEAVKRAAKLRETALRKAEAAEAAVAQKKQQLAREREKTAQLEAEKTRLLEVKERQEKARHEQERHQQEQRDKDQDEQEKRNTQEAKAKGSDAASVLAAGNQVVPGCKAFTPPAPTPNKADERSSSRPSSPGQLVPGCKEAAGKAQGQGQMQQGAVEKSPSQLVPGCKVDLQASLVALPSSPERRPPIDTSANMSDDDQPATPSKASREVKRSASGTQLVPGSV